MYLHLLQILLLTAIASTIIIPPRTSILQLPSQNLTTLSSLGNASNPFFGTWPHLPFKRHLTEDTEIEIISCKTPSPSQPVPESSIVADIRLLDAKVRSEGTRLALMVDYHSQSGLVEFGFHGIDNFFRGSEIAMILDMLAELTNLYGAAEIYGTLVLDDVDIAEFIIALKLASLEK